MSTEEQDRILGQLIRQRAESRTGVALLSAKLQDYGRAFAGAAAALGAIAERSHPAPDALLLSLDPLPDKSAVRALAEEFLAAVERLNSIERQLGDCPGFR